MAKNTFVAEVTLKCLKLISLDLKNNKHVK